MTVVNLTVDETALGGPVGAVGRVTVEYVAGSRGYVSVEGDRVVLPKPVTVRFTAGVLAEPLDVEPTRGVCAARVTIRPDSGRSLTRTVEIPDDGPVDFGDLADVNPASFEPVDPTPALDALIEQRIHDLTYDRY